MGFVVHSPLLGMTRTRLGAVATFGCSPPPALSSRRPQRDAIAFSGYTGT